MKGDRLYYAAAACEKPAYLVLAVWFAVGLIYMLIVF